MSDETTGADPDLEFEAEDAEERAAVEAAVSARTVRITQMDLDGLAYAAGAVDGVLGPRTREAIKEYQFNWQMRVTGRLTSQTYHKLLAHVRVVQVEAGGITADGVYGPATTAAVKRFQRHHHLHADGIAGPATHAAMGLKYQGP
jgi:peptidoglycan hydrolase-like protein with peptidoglycan-binding domain